MLTLRVVDRWPGPEVEAGDGNSRARRGWATVPGSIYEFFKDLGVPITLGVLAYLFQRLQQDRDRRHQTADRLSQRAHENVVRYYLRLSASTRQFASAAGAFSRTEQSAVITDTSEEYSLALRRATYFLARAVRINFSLQDGGGGVFLRRRTSEDLLAELWNFAYVRLRVAVGLDTMLHVVDALVDGDSLTTFEARFQRSAESGKTSSCPTVAHLAMFQGKLGAWLLVDEGRLIVELFDLYGRILLNEINELYEHWYPDRGDKELKHLLERLETARAETGWESKATKISAWSKEIHTDLTSLLESLGRYRGELGKRSGGAAYVSPMRRDADPGG